MGQMMNMPMQIGQRVQLGTMDGRVVREVMVSQDGVSVFLVYDNPPGQAESKRVLRLENVNGMLEVIYDQAAPSMPTAIGREISGSAR